MFIAGNWKQNCSIKQGNKLASSILDKIDGKVLDCEIAVFPPFTNLYSVSKILRNSKVFVGGQDCSQYSFGAYTGSISAEMLADIGCKYVLVGHSERRKHQNETNKLIKQKASMAQKQSLISIICVGETEEDRKSGKEYETVESQLTDSVPEVSSASNCIIAYEPVWAIGSGLTPNNEQIINMFAVIKDILESICKNNAIKILYGGSVNKTNFIEILSNGLVDGALIGGASLNANEFSEIVLGINN